MARKIEIGMGLTRAHRATYVGELGWEIYASTGQAAHIFEEILAAGAKPCGLHALDSCRLEKGYRHLGHDITDGDHVLEAGLGFAVKPDKGGFIGREAVLAKKADGLGYVPCEHQSAAEVLASDYQIEIAGARHEAVASLKSLYDPTSARVKEDA